MNARTVLEQVLQSGKEIAEQSIQTGKELVDRQRPAIQEIIEKGREYTHQTVQSSRDFVDRQQPTFKEITQKGRDFTRRGQTVVEEKLGVPESGAERDAMVSGMQVGAIAAGVLGLLVGTGTGRRVTGAAVKIGSLAALGGVAYKVYQQWQAQHNRPADLGTPVNLLPGEAAEARSYALLKATIAAAKADGQVDDAERAKIQQQVESLGLASELTEFVQTEIDKPLDIAEIAAAADSPTAAAEMYLASFTVIDGSQIAEREYLDTLARKLDLAPELATRLEREALSELDTPSSDMPESDMSESSQIDRSESAIC